MELFIHLLKTLSFIFISAVLALASTAAYAQDTPAIEEASAQDTLALYKGDWIGELDRFGLTLIVHIEGDTAETASVSLDSPDQGAFGFPGEIDAITNSELQVSLVALGAKFTVSPSEAGLSGLFMQRGIEIDLVLTPLAADDENAKPPARPQADALTRDYKIETVSFPGGADGVTLVGELTMPESLSPRGVLILISGSGPQDRNEELAGHKPFLILSDHLTQKGFAVLRYDDRGFGESTGDFSQATTKDFAEDAAAAMQYLTSQNTLKDLPIGLIGHSEGGLIAPLTAQTLRPDFMVLLAGPGEKLSDIIIRQTDDISAAQGVNIVTRLLQKGFQEAQFDVMRSASADTRRTNLMKLLKKQGANDAAAKAGVDQLTSPWMLWVFDYDPVPALTDYDGPVLALFGEKDLQVAAETNAEIMRPALTHSASKVETLTGLNHLFQPAENGSPSEYAKIETTFDEGAMERISDWVNSVIGQ